MYLPDAQYRRSYKERGYPLRCAAQRILYKGLVLTGQTYDRTLRTGPQSKIYKAVTALHLLKDSGPSFSMSLGQFLNGRQSC